MIFCKIPLGIIAAGEPIEAIEEKKQLGPKNDA